MRYLQNMADSTHEKGTGFADLSAELRNDIYRLTLTSDEDIELCGPDEHHRLKLGRTICPNILRVRRFINSEATSILYVENVFAATATTLCDWIKQIGGNKRHLRSMTITIHPKSIDLQRLLKLLLTAPHLGKLRFLYNPFSKKDHFHNDFGENSFAKIVCPFVRAWYRQHQCTDPKAAVNVLELSGYVWFEYGWDPVKEAILNRKTSQFKKLMQDHLEHYDQAKIELERAKIVLEDAIISTAEVITRHRKPDSGIAELDVNCCNEIELHSNDTQASRTQNVQPKVTIRGGHTFDAYGADTLVALRNTCASILTLKVTDWSANEQRQACLKIGEDLPHTSLDYT